MAITLPSTGNAGGKGEPGPVFATRVELADRASDLERFHTMDLDVDGVFDGWARIYLTQEELEKLQRLGYGVSVLPQQPGPSPEAPQQPREPGLRTIPTTYHTYDTLAAELNAIATAHPDLTRLFTLGTSASLPPDPVRQLWMMKITDSPDDEEDEPEVAYIAAMHGDEVVGKELCIEFIHHLLDNYGTDSRVTALVDNTEIWIMPSMNPDGTALNQRYNSNGFDLNRDFPDWFADPVNSTAGRQPETAAVMNWVAAHSIDLSANFHGGALVANYPWDNNPSGSSVFSPTPDPDHDTFHSISLTYAENNGPMYASPSFPRRRDQRSRLVCDQRRNAGLELRLVREVRRNVGDRRRQVASREASYRRSGTRTSNRCCPTSERIHEGLRGIVSDAATGLPVAAEIRIDGDEPFPVQTDPDVGDYHRVLLPGSYVMEISAAGYYPATMPITVEVGPAARYDVGLEALPADLQPISDRVDSEPSGNGWIDPGETVDLAVTLKNLGSLATSISGRLIPTGWFADVVQPEATYPDLASQERRRIGRAVLRDAHRSHGSSRAQDRPGRGVERGPGC